jgi:VCBS repeat protein
LKTTACGIRRFVGRLLGAAAAVCLVAAPARAALDADFNGDGIIDRIVLPRPPETRIVVRLSGGVPQVLNFHDRIISVVAADVDHDGDLDIGALSERRGVFIWLNKGRGPRHFKALRPRHRTGGLSFNTHGPLASAPGSSADGPAATGTDDDRDRLAHADHITYDVGDRPALDHRNPTVPTLRDDRGSASPSRAPPALENPSIQFR